jgi:hypothetical protein
VHIHLPSRRNLVPALLAVLGALIIGSGALAPLQSEAAVRWVYVGKEPFLVDGNPQLLIPTYVNTNSIEGDRYDTFTVTFQARYAGKQGIDRVNVGVVVDCNEYEAYADQFYVYYSKRKSDYVRTDGGDLSQRIRTRALSYCR